MLFPSCYCLELNFPNDQWGLGYLVNAPCRAHRTLWRHGEVRFSHAEVRQHSLLRGKTTPCSAFCLRPPAISGDEPRCMVNCMCVLKNQNHLPIRQAKCCCFLSLEWNMALWNYGKLSSTLNRRWVSSDSRASIISIHLSVWLWCCLLRGRGSLDGFIPDP